MVTIEGEEWFSCGEIAEGINSNDSRFLELKKKYCRTFGYARSHYFDYQYIQNHLYKANKNKEIRHCVYHNSKAGCARYVYTIKDLYDWVSMQEKKMIAKYEIIGVAE